MVDVTIGGDGLSLLELGTFTAGRLPIRAASIGRYLRNKAGNSETIARVGEWLGKLEAVKFKPVLELEHCRRARVVASASDPKVSI